MNKLIKAFVISIAFMVIGSTVVSAKTFGGYVDDTVDAVKSGTDSTVNAVKDTTNSTTAAVSDQNLEHKVNNVLSAQVPDGSFTVASYYKRILLTGQVPNKEDKSKAELAVKNTAGVKGVWNYLTIEANEDAAAISKDAMITTDARNKLLLQKGVNSNNIKVVTDNGVVYLLGRNTGKTSKINLAIKEISQIDGVSKVVNLIEK